MDPILSLSRPHSKGGFSNGLLLPSCSLYLPHRLFFPQTIKRTRNFRLKRSVPRAASASPGLDGSSRRVRQGQRAYQQSQGVGSSFRVPVNEVVSVVAPAGVFLAVTFVLWKMVEKLLVSKPGRPSSEESRSSLGGMKWSFAPGTNLSSGASIKIERESRQKLNDFAKELRSFRSVDMSGRNFGDEGLFFLAESLAYNQNAEEVDFSANGITAAGLKALDGVLQSNVILKTLNLSGNAVGDEGAKCLSDILMGNDGIHKLQLNSAGLGDEGAKAIAEMLKKNSGLRVLELNNNMIDYSGFTSLAGAFLENNTIRAIHLNGNYGGALGAAALAKGIEGNKSLRELHLHGNSIGNEGVRALLSGLSAHKGKISLLDISNNEIGSKGAFHIAEFIKKSKSLLWLNLYMNDIGDEGAERIADALKQNHTITTLDLGGNNIHEKGVTAIAQVLKDNSVITTLELGYNPIGPEGAKSLSEVLKYHGKIETLKLGWCQLGAKGAEYIADLLKYNTTISTLDLRANGLGDNGTISLAGSLKIVNEALCSLDLGFNEIRDNGAFALARALKANEEPALTSLNLASNFITKYGQPSIIKPLDNQLSLADVDTIKVIGMGSGGIVQLVRHKWTGQFFALKWSWYIYSHDLGTIHPLVYLKASEAKIPPALCYLFLSQEIERSHKTPLSLSFPFHIRSTNVAFSSSSSDTPLYPKTPQSHFLLQQKSPSFSLSPNPPDEENAIFFATRAQIGGFKGFHFKILSDLLCFALALRFEESTLCISHYTVIQMHEPSFICMNRVTWAPFMRNQMTLMDSA